ncbi:putative acetyltransferase [Spiractinospora alimapuensis]
MAFRRQHNAIGGLVAGYRLVHEVTPRDVGRRVMVRYRLVSGQMTDVVGVLIAWEGEEISVQRRDGQVTQVIASTVIASKVIPPAPSRSSNRR